MTQQNPKEKEARVVEGGEEDQRSEKQGDNRTPDEVIGEVAYANRDPAKKKTGEF